MPPLGVQEILDALPHRYPMLLVDRILELDEEEKRIVGLKNLTINEPFFQGHFPGMPIMPGVLQLEAMAQVGGILLIRLAAAKPNTRYFLMSVDKAKFRKVAQPGDQLRIEVAILSVRSKAARFTGHIYVDDKLVSEAELMCMITEQDPSA